MRHTPERNKGSPAGRSQNKPTARESAGSIPQRPAPPLQRGNAATRQRSEAGREARHEFLIGGQLHAVDVLVERHQNETIELRDKVPQPGKWSAKE
jgi:hypothetical protein